MALRFSTGLCNQILGTDSYSGIFTNAVIDVYTGAQPVSADAAPTGTLLGQVTESGGAFAHGSPTNGLNFGTPADATIDKDAGEDWLLTAVADGTAGWFRLKANPVDDDSVSTTLPRMDGVCGSLGSGAELRMSNTTIVNGSTTTIDVAQISLNRQRT